MDQKLKVMLIEDNPGDARLIQEELADAQEGGDSQVQVDFRWFNLISVGLAYLSKGEFDVVLLDMNLPDGSGLENIDRILSVSPDIPIIILTGLKDELTMSRALRKGAQNYVVKGGLNGGELLQVIFDAIDY